MICLDSLSTHHSAAQLSARQRQHTPTTTLVGTRSAGRLHLGVGSRVLLVVICMDCYASCMAWVVTLHATLKGTRPQPKLATHCTIPIHGAVGNGFPKKAPRVRLRRYPSCSHENLFLGEKIRKSSRRLRRSKVHAPSRCWGAMAPAEASRRSLAGGLRKPHGYGY